MMNPLATLPGLYGLNGWSVVIFTFSFFPKFFFLNIILGTIFISEIVLQ